MHRGMLRRGGGVNIPPAPVILIFDVRKEGKREKREDYVGITGGKSGDKRGKSEKLGQNNNHFTAICSPRLHSPSNLKKNI